jgi:hypothetical protein
VIGLRFGFYFGTYRTSEGQISKNWRKLALFGFYGLIATGKIGTKYLFAYGIAFSGTMWICGKLPQFSYLIRRRRSAR